MNNNDVGGDLVRRNWILKLALYSIQYDVKQTHLLNLADNGKAWVIIVILANINLSKKDLHI